MTGDGDGDGTGVVDVDIGDNVVVEPDHRDRLEGENSRMPRPQLCVSWNANLCRGSANKLEGKHGPVRSR